jgi:hypothetical protein
MLFRSLFRRRRMEADLDNEMRDHIDQEIQHNIRGGMSAEDAKFAAQRLVGPLSTYKEECRDARGISFIENFTRDLRFSIRTLRRTPLFTIVAILTLALGIGANTTVFTFVENILMRSVPARDPQQLLSLNWDHSANMSYPNYIDFRDRNTVFSGLVACDFDVASMSIKARENFRVFGFEASGNYLTYLV